MAKNWKKEIARDAIALGSILFYLIVIIRAIIGKYLPFIYQLLFALLILFILSRIQSFNQHIARALVLVVFTSLFYKEILYTAFVVFIFVIMIFSSIYLKIKATETIKGILYGAISIIISYYLTLILLPIQNVTY